MFVLTIKPHNAKHYVFTIVPTLKDAYRIIGNSKRIVFQISRVTL